MLLLLKDMKDWVVVHSGKRMKILANLLHYCLPWDCIPLDIGGYIDLDFEQWLSKCMVKEDQETLQKPAVSSSSFLGTFLQQEQPSFNPPGTDLNIWNGLGDHELCLLHKLIQQSNIPDENSDKQASHNINFYPSWNGELHPQQSNNYNPFRNQVKQLLLNLSNQKTPVLAMNADKTRPLTQNEIAASNNEQPNSTMKKKMMKHLARAQNHFSRVGERATHAWIVQYKQK